MALTEVQSIYYGLQLIGLHMPDELQADKLFVMRARFVPLNEWTDSMWMEGARIVSTQRGIFGDRPCHSGRHSRTGPTSPFGCWGEPLRFSMS